MGRNQQQVVGVGFAQGGERVYGWADGDFQIFVEKVSGILRDEKGTLLTGISERCFGREEGTALHEAYRLGNQHDLLHGVAAAFRQMTDFPLQAFDIALHGTDCFFLLHDFIGQEFDKFTARRVLIEYSHLCARNVKISER